MKLNLNNTTVFYTALVITALITLFISIGLNFLWFALYEFVKRQFDFTLTQTSIAIGAVIWAFAMVRAVPIITKR